MSARSDLAERIAQFIRDNDLDNPFGGEADRLNAARYYSILLSIPRVLDGIVMVYGPKFIQVVLQGQMVGGGRDAVFESEEDTLTFLRALLVDRDGDAADAVPTKARA